MVYAGFMSAFYALAIPTPYAALMLKDRHLLANNSRSNCSGSADALTQNLRVRATSNLWKPYKPNRFHYEVTECARRILLAGVVVFIYTNTSAQIAATLVIAFIFTMISEGLIPDVFNWDS